MYFGVLALSLGRGFSTIGLLRKDAMHAEPI
jgi:hypothetical protein